MTSLDKSVAVENEEKDNVYESTKDRFAEIGEFSCISL